MITPKTKMGEGYSIFSLFVFLFFLLALLSFQSGERHIKYSEVRIFLPSKEVFSLLAQQGLILPEAKIEKNAIVTVLNESDIAILQNSGVEYEILIADVVEEYNRRPKLSRNESLILERQMRDTYGIEGFGFGSMGGFYTLQEIYQKMDSMRLLYPHLTTAKDSIGSTIENRPIYAMKISSNPSINDPTKPEVFYNALTHAREPQGMMAVMYFMFYLLENYGTDPEVTYLLNHRQLWFVPCVNPDGYYYNQTTNPNGGGQWRKNRRNNGGSYGVDLNRNFAYRWGYDNTGSSPTPSNDTYRGPSPASEPETQALQNFCNQRQFKAALNYHTYSNLLIYPWGYINQTTPDSVRFTGYARDMTEFNKYAYGTPAQLLYVVNGGADDWMYGNDSMGHPKIFSMTPEVGTTGFWPSQNEIFPLAAENLYPNLYLAWAAGKFPQITDIRTSKNTYQPGDSGQIRIALKNNGIETNITTDYELTTPHEGIILYNSVGSVSQTQFGEVDTIIIPFRLSNTIPSSCAFINILVVSLDGTPVYQKKVSVLVGQPTQIIFADDGETDGNNWTTTGSSNGTWGKTSTQFRSPSNSFTDSPSGSYLNNANAMMTLNGSLNFTNIAGATFSFWDRYATESGYDFCNTEISTNGGSSWISLARYSGTNTTWTQRRYNISDLVAGKTNVKIRFVLTSDGSQTADGWYVDDILINGYVTAPLIDITMTEKPVKEFSLMQNYPNPFNPSTVIRFQLPVNTKVSLKIYNILGQQVRTLVEGYQKAGNHSIPWDGRDNMGRRVSGGLYIYRLETSDFSETRKMMFLK